MEKCYLPIFKSEFWKTFELLRNIGLSLTCFMIVVLL